MEIKIKGKAKKIAALVLEVQGRQSPSLEKEVKQTLKSLLSCDNTRLEYK